MRDVFCAGKQDAAGAGSLQCVPAPVCGHAGSVHSCKWTCWEVVDL